MAKVFQVTQNYRISELPPRYRLQFYSVITGIFSLKHLILTQTASANGLRLTRK